MMIISVALTSSLPQRWGVIVSCQRHVQVYQKRKRQAGKKQDAS
jgi:hypothetical protein